MRRFEDKVVLVTGAASGIGFAAAERFVREGGAVIATDLRADALEEAWKGPRAEGLAVETVQHDVTSPEQWAQIVGEIVARHGKLNVLFNNAGIGDFALLEETTLEQWRAVNAVNLDGVFFGMQAVIPTMRECGGAIVNNSSIAGMIGEPLLPAYSATKGGVRSMTKAVAIDCARRGDPIRINSIHAGYTNTNLVTTAVASLGDEAEAFVEESTQSIPMQRLAEPSEIAGPVLFLASDDASFMTGSELTVDGGYTAA